MPKPPFLNEYEFKFICKGYYTIRKYKAIHIGVAWYSVACDIAKGISRLQKVEFVKMTK